VGGAQISYSPLNPLLGYLGAAQVRSEGFEVHVCRRPARPHHGTGCPGRREGAV